MGFNSGFKGLITQPVSQWVNRRGIVTLKGYIEA